MTTQQKRELSDIKKALIEKYGASTPLCELPESEFDFGGDFDELARAAGYAGGKAMANESRSWSVALEIVANNLI